MSQAAFVEVDGADETSRHLVGTLNDAVAKLETVSDVFLEMIHARRIDLTPGAIVAPHPRYVSRR